MESSPLTLQERLELFIEKALKAGFRVDGLPLAKALLEEETLSRMEKLFFNEPALSFFKKKVGRVEFITEGPLPPELLNEPLTKSEPIFRQVVGYGICKACRLCIQVCPKHVYKDDGFGRPDAKIRREEECTGPQCGQCIDICPEHTIQLILADPVFKSTLFLLLPNPHADRIDVGGSGDFFVLNPLETHASLKITQKINPKDLKGCHRLFNEVKFYPILEIGGYSRHLVDSAAPEKELIHWAKENSRNPDLVLDAVRLLYAELGELNSLKQGKYRLDKILHRIIDEILHPNIEMGRAAGKTLLAKIVGEGWMAEGFLGAKLRPIGGVLPPGTSLAWKTPYGDEIPFYAHVEKCLGPECALCVTQCPEGGGGKNSAIRMTLKVPRGTIPSLVRGLGAYLLKLDGSHKQWEDLENLTGKTPFEFEVEPDYCKACGICIACCPHDVIEPTPRIFDLRKAAE